MKKITQLSTLLLCLLVAKTAAAQESFKWKEMGAFHSTAMLSFHGAEEGNLKPTHDSAVAMLQKAKAWQASPAPQGKDAAAIKTLLQTLVNQCAAISDAIIAKKPDADIKPLVLKAHHTFHELIEKAN